MNLLSVYLGGPSSGSRLYYVVEAVELLFLLLSLEPKQSNGSFWARVTALLSLASVRQFRVMNRQQLKLLGVGIVSVLLCRKVGGFTCWFGLFLSSKLLGDVIALELLSMAVVKFRLCVFSALVNNSYRFRYYHYRHCSCYTFLFCTYM